MSFFSSSNTSRLPLRSNNSLQHYDEARLRYLQEREVEPENRYRERRRCPCDRAHIHCEHHRHGRHRHQSHHNPSQQRGPPSPPSSVFAPSPRPPNVYSPNSHMQHPASVPAYMPALAASLFSAADFLHLYLSPGQLGVLASPEHAHQNPDVTRPVIIMHPQKNYRKLMERVGHAVKSVNPPAWGVSDIPPATWEGWGVKLFLPRDGPRVFKEIWETVGDKLHHLEVRLIPPQSQIDHNWFCVTYEQIMALENTRWDEEVEMYGRLGPMKYAEDAPAGDAPAEPENARAQG